MLTPSPCSSPRRHSSSGHSAEPEHNPLAYPSLKSVVAAANDAACSCATFSFSIDEADGACDMRPGAVPLDKFDTRSTLCANQASTLELHRTSQTCQPHEPEAYTALQREDCDPDPGGSASAWSDFSERNPIPSATTMSITDTLHLHTSMNQQPMPCNPAFLSRTQFPEYARKAASIWSDLSLHNPVPSATTLSVRDEPLLDTLGHHLKRTADPHRDMRTVPMDTSSQCSEPCSAAGLSAMNPIITPNTSETASLLGHENLRGYSYGCPSRRGLTTVDEVPKPPPAYLMETSGDKAHDRPSVDKEPSSPSATLRTDMVDSDLLQDVQRAQETADLLAFQNHPDQAPLQLQAHRGTRVAQTSLDKDVNEESPEAQGLQQSAKSKDSNSCGFADSCPCLEQSPWEDQFGGLQKMSSTVPTEQLDSKPHEADLAASLEMYEARLEEAKGRTCELTDYLTQLKSRVDEVRMEAWCELTVA
jgi:hypothetical protein